MAGAHGEDLRGRTCLITGASSGIGRAAALALAARGASLVLVCRDRDRGRDAMNEIRERTGNGDLELRLADLSSQTQVRRLAREIIDGGRPLEVLLNNAGVINLRRSETEDGIETTFAVNHLAPFLLTVLLLDRLRESAPARVVTVASDAHRWEGRALALEELARPRRYSALTVYGRSKLANILFTRELARRLDGSGVSANCLHPGFVASGFARNNGWIGSVAMTLARPFARTPQQGAETAVQLCASPQYEGVNGQYFFDGRRRRPHPAAERDEDARRLWALSERLTGLEA